MLTKCLYPIAFGGMMARGKIVNAALAGDVHRWLGDLATDEGIQSAISGRGQIRLCCAGAPTDADDRLGLAGDVLRCTAQTRRAVPARTAS